MNDIIKMKSWQSKSEMIVLIKSIYFDYCWDWMTSVAYWADVIINQITKGKYFLPWKSVSFYDFHVT
jgi:hypothetical protein